MKPYPAVGGSKYIKRLLSGTWDMANRYFLMPGGITDAHMKLKGINGINLLRFSAFECAEYQIGWDEADYSINFEDPLNGRELRKLKRCPPDPVDIPFPHMHGSTDFYNNAYTAHLGGGRVPLRSGRLSPLKGGCASPLIGPVTGQVVLTLC